MRNHPSFVVATGLAALVTLTACSAPEGSTPAPPSNAGSDVLNVACSQQEDFCQAISAAFESETGIKTTYVRLGSGEVLARLDTTPGEFDIWAGGQAENHLLADDRGHVERYVSPDAAALPAHYNDEAGIWSGFYTDSVAFCSNQKELDRLGLDAPTSWDDLLVGELAGSVAMPHPATAGVGYMAMFAVATINGGDEEKTIEYFTALNSNVMQYSKSAATGTEQAGRGEVAVAIALDADCNKANNAGFADLVTSYPAEGTGFEVGAVSLLANAANADNAKKFFDWLLTTDAQNLYSQIPSFAVPTVPGAEIGAGVPRQDTVTHVEWDVRLAADSRDTYISAFETRIAAANDAV